MDVAQPGKVITQIRELADYNVLAVLPRERQRALLKKAREMAEQSGVGEAWFEIGMVYHRLNELPDAIECYEKAVSDSRFKLAGNAYNNMGGALYAMGEYPEAIECHKRALDTPSFSTSAKAWFNMGNCYFFGLKDYQKAIECYEYILEK